MKIILFLALLIGTTLPAIAGSCVALDYQEIKEMAEEDLQKELCKVTVSIDANFKDLLGPLGTRPGDHQRLVGLIENCVSQRDRITRVLAQKGVKVTSEYAACKAK